MQIADMKTRLTEKIKALEKERNMLLEEVKQLKEVVELSEKSKELESDVNRLKDEVNALKARIPKEILREIGEVEPSFLEEEKKEKMPEEECISCGEDFL